MAVFGSVSFSPLSWTERVQALAEMHPYEVPEIVAVEPVAVAEAYTKGVIASLNPSEDP